MKHLVRTGIIAAFTAASCAPILLLAPQVGAQQDVNPVVPTEPMQSTTDTTFPSSTAEIQQGLCAGANLDVTSNCQSGVTGQDATAEINALIADVINIFSLVVGVVAVIMIIIGGFRYITSGGDSSNVSGAKNTILYAIIGLVIVALSQTIVRFVLGRVITA
jgi:hypothetical protein